MLKKQMHAVTKNSKEFELAMRIIGANAKTLSYANDYIDKYNQLVMSSDPHLGDSTAKIIEEMLSISKISIDMELLKEEPLDIMSSNVSHCAESNTFIIVRSKEDSSCSKEEEDGTPKIKEYPVATKVISIVTETTIGKVNTLKESSVFWASINIVEITTFIYGIRIPVTIVGADANGRIVGYLDVSGRMVPIDGLTIITESSPYGTSFAHQQSHHYRQQRHTTPNMGYNQEVPQDPKTNVFDTSVKFNSVLQDMFIVSAFNVNAYMDKITAASSQDSTDITSEQVNGK